MADVPQYSPQTVAEMVAKGDVTLVDTRNPEDRQNAPLPPALPNITLSEFLQNHGDHSEDREVVFSCYHGITSLAVAAQVKAELGLRTASLAGGAEACHRDLPASES